MSNSPLQAAVSTALLDYLIGADMREIIVWTPQQKAEKKLRVALAPILDRYSAEQRQAIGEMRDDLAEMMQEYFSDPDRQDCLGLSPAEKAAVMAGLLITAVEARYGSGSQAEAPPRPAPKPAAKDWRPVQAALF